MTRRVAVVGAGITGICVACELALCWDVEVTVVERDPAEPRGSTALAPGLLGLYNDAPVLVELARRSAHVYEGAGQGFARPGGLELAVSETGAVEVERRVTAARSAGLPAQLRSPSDLPGSVTTWVDSSQVVAVGSFPGDGVAAPALLAQSLRARAVAAGARFLTGQEVVAVDGSEGGLVVRTREGLRLPVDDVVLAGGVWGPGLGRLTGLELPLFPVAHPYVYGPPTPGLGDGPFVRWPEAHVYARAHGDRLGIGSYDHAPVLVDPRALAAGAGLAWDDDFTEVIASAQRLLRPGARSVAQARVNGVFAMTPDNLPFLGPHPQLDGVWVAQALWVTHAAGAAQALVAAMLGTGPSDPQLAVDRFGAIDEARRRELQDAALRLYRDIYASGDATRA